MPTNGVLAPKLKLREKLMSLTSANGAVRNRGKSGSIATATLIAGTHIPVNGEVAIGPFANLAKGGRSGDEWQEEGQYYRTQSFYRGGRKGGKKGGKGGGKEGRGK